MGGVSAKSWTFVHILLAQAGCSNLRQFLGKIRLVEALVLGSQYFVRDVLVRNEISVQFFCKKFKVIPLTGR